MAQCTTAKPCDPLKTKKNIFMSFLEEYERKPPTDVVRLKRERFARLHHHLLKYIFLRNFTNAYHVVKHMKEILQQDEYKDEYVDAPVEQIEMYLEVVLVYCTFNIHRDIEACIETCNEILTNEHELFFPVLYMVLAGCYLKLGRTTRALLTIQNGIDGITENFHRLEASRKLSEKTVFKFGNMGDNSPRHVLFVLYSHSKQFDLNNDDKVRDCCKRHSMEADFESLTKQLKRSTPSKCCYGPQVNETLEYQKIDLSMSDVPQLAAYYDELEFPVVSHVDSHCQMRSVVVGCDDRVNILIYVKRFGDVPSIIEELVQVGPSLVKTIKSVQLDADTADAHHDSMPHYTAHVYVEMLDACRRTVGSKAAERNAAEPTPAFLRDQMSRLVRCLVPRKGDADGRVELADGGGARPALTDATCKITEETQTAPAAERAALKSRQTQTDKTSLDELDAWKHVDLLESDLAAKQGKVAELEGKILEANEARRECVDNQTKTIKALRKELNQAKKTVVEKNKEITHQKYQIDQLQNNLSKLNKSYSHAVKPPEECPKASCSKALMRENEKLQVMNANFSAENVNLQKQLDEMTEEFDKMKARRDALVDTNEELKLLFLEKSKQYEELYNRVKALKNENVEQLKVEQNKMFDLRSIIVANIKEFIDLLVNKLTQYKVRCERIYQDITYYFYNVTPNLNIKQTCESNQMYLVTLIRQMERNMQLLLVAKEIFRVPTEDTVEAFQAQIGALNWKDMIVCADEFCGPMITQYVNVLNAIMATHKALSSAQLENARLVNQNLNAHHNGMLDAEKFYRGGGGYQAEQRRYSPGAGKAAGHAPNVSSAHGAIGTNRPAVSYGAPRPPSPDIDDPNTRNILSQIGHAVNYPGNLSLAHNPNPRSVQQQAAVEPPPQMGRKLCGSFGSTRSSPSPNANAGAYWSKNQAAGQEYSMKENYAWSQPTQDQHSPMSSADSADSGMSVCGEHREIYVAIKKRFPNALMADLISGLKFLISLNINLKKMPLESIFENIGSYIEQQMQMRLKKCDTTDIPPPTSTATDEFCTICFEKLNLLPATTLKCLHVFHEKCIHLWLRHNNICPICRKLTVME